MNTKIIVALVIGIALIGLTGAASASLYDDYMARSSGNIYTNTDITGTHFTSSSQTRVSGIPVSSHYTQSFRADLRIPIFPPADFCNTDMNLAGTDYAWTTAIQSAPTENTVSIVISNPSDVSGTMTRQNCALLGQSIESMETPFPQPIYEPTESLWWGTHPAGYAYPAHSRESHSISWGSWSNWP